VQCNFVKDLNLKNEKHFNIPLRDSIKEVAHSGIYFLAGLLEMIEVDWLGPENK
jgi:hypothetical protein